jgi:hypothetical protein
MKVKEVKRRLNLGTTFKQKRKTSSYNATVALVMEELNEGKFSQMLDKVLSLHAFRSCSG